MTENTQSVPEIGTLRDTYFFTQVHRVLDGKHTPERCPPVHVEISAEFGVSEHAHRGVEEGSSIGCEYNHILLTLTAINHKVLPNVFRRLRELVHCLNRPLDDAVLPKVDLRVFESGINVNGAEKSDPSGVTDEDEGIHLLEKEDEEEEDGLEGAEEGARFGGTVPLG
jgi:hypothetical protein